MSELKQTPLHDRHAALGARIVPFAGYEMPVQYAGGIIEEHRAVRQAVGMFDVSHMGEVHLEGPGAGACLDHLTPSRASALPVGRVMYSGLTTGEGTFVDDVLVYRLAGEHYLVVVNAANHDKDVAWMREKVRGFDVELTDRSAETALIALQGPRARRTFARIVEGFEAMDVKYYHVVEGRAAGVPVLASRTGYTGELGWEIFTSPADAPTVWDALLEAGAEYGVSAAGLGARDTLRLEAALPLYGNDIDESTSVLEAGLDFMVDWTKDDFLGKAALEAERGKGLSRVRVGFELDGRGIARHGHDVYCGGEKVGTVTSGAYAPWLEKAVGMAYVPVELSGTGSGLEIEVRGRTLAARVVELPFYKRPKKKQKSS